MTSSYAGYDAHDILGRFSLSNVVQRRHGITIANIINYEYSHGKRIWLPVDIVIKMDDTLRLSRMITT